MFVFIVTLEVSARIDGSINYGAPLWGPYDSTLLEESDSEGILHNVPNSQFEKWKINKFGFRGDEVTQKKNKDITRIACMGASESFGLYEDPGKEWPAQLNDLLSPGGQFQIINTSVAGLGLRNFKSYLRKYVLKFEPDLVILYINPYFYVSQISRSLRKTSKLQNQEVNQPVSRGPTSKLLAVKLRIFPKIKQMFKKIIPPWILKRYQIWNTTRQVNSLEKNLLNGTSPLDTVPDEYLNSFRNDLIDLVHFLTEQRIGVILSSYPVLISKMNLEKYPEIFFDNRRFCIELSFEGMIKAPQCFNSAIQSVANDLGVCYVDSFIRLPKDIQYFGDNVHYTNQGARLIAFNFAQYILNHRSLESNFLDVPF
jgi:lysophospholipase L1-like esterase